MKIIINTDKTIDGSQRHRDFYTTQITEELKIYESEITRVDVHVSDQNGIKDGENDIRCLLEVRIEGKHPIVVTCQADTEELAIAGAIENLKACLEKVHERMKNY